MFKSNLIRYSHAICAETSFHTYDMPVLYQDSLEKIQTCLFMALNFWDFFIFFWLGSVFVFLFFFSRKFHFNPIKSLRRSGYKTLKERCVNSKSEVSRHLADNTTTKHNDIKYFHFFLIWKLSPTRVSVLVLQCFVFCEPCGCVTLIPHVRHVQSPVRGAKFIYSARRKCTWSPLASWQTLNMHVKKMAALNREKESLLRRQLNIFSTEIRTTKWMNWTNLPSPCGWVQCHYHSRHTTS